MVYKITYEKKQDWLIQFKEKNQKMPGKDLSKNYRTITHSIYLVGDPKTGKIEQECRTQKEV